MDASSPQLAMFTCGWCHTSYSHWQPNCSNCGGPLPPQPGMGIGPEPPTAPRALPRGFAFRMKWSRNFAVLGGLFCLLISGLMTYAMIKAGTFLAIVPAVFSLLGFSLFRHGRKLAVGMVHAFHKGTAVEGKIVGLSLDMNTAVNDRHPWKLTYQFPVGEGLHEGSLSSFDSTVGARSTGQSVWVLYLPEDPEQCTLYPPVRQGVG